jgi:hypothetical protein
VNVPQQRLDVLLHVMIARSAPEIGGVLVIVLERGRRRRSQILGCGTHGLGVPGYSPLAVGVVMGDHEAPPGAHDCISR